MLANLNDVLIPARQQKYAIGLFNTVNLEQARGVLEAAEELRSPVIIGTAESLFPYGPIRELADFLLPMARRADVPVVVHLDHGTTEEACRQAIELGFSSIMYDCSTFTYEENLEKVAEMTRIAHESGVTIEAELGHVGDNKGAGELSDPSMFYTEPAQAKEFAERTNVDALAIAVGTAHGAYKLPPQLDFARIREIASMIGTPLVLHGGSGLSDEDFQKAVQEGISKVNIFTDMNVAGAKAAVQAYGDGMGLTDLIPDIVEATKQAAIRKMKLFGSANRA